MSTEHKATRISATPESRAFYNWMIEIHHLSPASSRSYSSAINNCEQLASELGISNTKLYGVSLEEAKDVIKQLKESSSFIEKNKQQHNRLDSSLDKFLMYLSGDRSTVSITDTSSCILDQLVPNTDEYWLGILTKFKKLRIDSAIDYARLIKEIKSSCNIDIDESNPKLKKAILKRLYDVGFVYDAFLYSPSSVLDEETNNKLITYIFERIDSGDKAVYFSRIWTEFTEEFSSQNIYGKEMLKHYLQKELGTLFSFNDECLYIGEEFNTVDLNSKISEVLIEVGLPISVLDIIQKLPDFEENEIKKCLNDNPRFIRNKPNEYFDVSIIDISHDEIKIISNILKHEISTRGFISWKELLELLSLKLANFDERFSLITEIGLRDVLRFHLNKEFSFNGNIISETNKKLSMKTIYESFARERDSFTLDELNTLKNELGSTIYFDAIYSNAIRISQTQFVKKGSIDFDVERIDCAISTFCSGEYIAISDVTSFSSFPYVGVSWNEYLLEYYVAEYSNKFKLIHTGFNADVCVGAIVKRSSKFESFQDVQIDALSKCSDVLGEDNALDYLCNHGFLARRRKASDFHLIVEKARIKRGE